MVAEERKQQVHICVHIIHRHRIIHTGQTVAPTLTVILQCLTNSLLNREVHYGRQVGIKSVKISGSALPISHSRSRSRPALTYYINMRILGANSSKPFASRYLLNIRIRINTQSVQVCILNPPDSPQLEILQQIGVLQVHIWHRRVEPTTVGKETIVLRSVDVIIGGKHIVRVRELVELVNPIVIGEVSHPPVCSAAVVRHHIHQNLQTFRMSLLYHLLIQLIASVAGVNMVVVRASIAVITPCRFVVT